ncbi:hypothetical protein KJ782_07200 [Patescibacteria group bacterium]|nr:hypothetical protein [Patescibacteria group bacterium]
MYGGGTAYVETGGKEPVEVQVFDRAGAPLLGKSDIKLRIRRHSDDLYYDWDDDTFKAYGSVTTLLQPLTAVNDIQSPGVYHLNSANHVRGFDTSKITNLSGDDVLEITVVQDGGSDSAGLPVGFELKIGHFLDTMIRIVGLQKENYFIDQMVYNASGLMTAARVRLFPTKAAVNAATDGGADEGELAVYTFTSTPNPTNQERPDVVRSVRDA